MNKEKVASELLKIAKELVALDERVLDPVIEKSLNSYVEKKHGEDAVAQGFDVISMGKESRGVLGVTVRYRFTDVQTMEDGQAIARVHFKLTKITAN
jgi:hypothetical protein